MTGASTLSAKKAGTSTGFRGDIQGLRAIAVLLVLLYHASVPGFGAGYVGVDVFFVISGYLITAHLLKQLDEHGRIRFLSFYSRRVQRLLPASIVVIILTVTGAILFLPRVLMREELLAAAAALLYVPNMYFAVRGSDYLAGGSESIVQQFWSLGVEEQFYLLWPLLLLLSFYLARKKRVALIIVISVVVAASFTLCVLLTGQMQPWAFYSLPTRAWELGTGGLVALAVPWIRKLSPITGDIFSWSGIVLLGASVVTLAGNTHFPGPAALLPVAGTALLIAAGDATGGKIVGSALSVSPMRFIGDISYSIYLVHWPLLVLPVLAIGEPLPLHVNVLLMLLSVGVAYLLYRFVEDPLRRLPALRVRPKTVLVGALLSALVLAGSAMALRPVVQSIPVSSGIAVDPLPAPTEQPETISVVPSNMAPELLKGLDDNARVYDTPCHISELDTIFETCAFGDVDSEVTVVLFGDSHTANWFPAFEEIAKAEGFRLESYSKSRCSSADVEKTFQGRPYWECEQWRDEVIDYLNQIEPELVVLSNYSPNIGDETSFVDQNDPTEVVWSRGLSDVITQLTGAKHVTVLEDTPRQAQDPLECLSRHVKDAAQCATAVDQALSSVVNDAEQAAVLASGGQYVSLNDYLCNAQECPVIIGNLLAYRDSHHLTATFSRWMSPIVADTVILSALVEGD